MHIPNEMKWICLSYYESSLIYDRESGKIYVNNICRTILSKEEIVDNPDFDRYRQNINNPRKVQ